MSKNKHLNLDERCKIQEGLDMSVSFKGIGESIGKDCTTVSKEVKGHILYVAKGAPYRPFNDCQHRRNCDHCGDICGTCTMKSRKKCSICGLCVRTCSDYAKEACPLLRKPPYVCNGCGSRNTCTLEKHLYDARTAQREYEEVRSESRSGINLTEDELAQLNSVISPLLEQGQSLHHILVNNPDKISCCEKTAYTYVDCGLFDARNIDMPRKVRFSPRRKSVEMKVDKSCRIGRTLDDFGAYVGAHAGIPIAEIDSVEGRKGCAVLLTIHFVIAKFQLAFRREANNSRSVTEVFDGLYEILGKEIYMRLFPVLLADNGTEFSNPKAIETGPDGECRSRLFYCNPSSPNEKGACENNHEFIRRVIPKGVDIGMYSQEQITLMMNHINSYARPDLGNKTPFEAFAFYYGEDALEALKALGVETVRPNDITLKPSLLARSKN